MRAVKEIAKEKHNEIELFCRNVIQRRNAASCLGNLAVRAGQWMPEAGLASRTEGKGNAWRLMGMEVELGVRKSVVLLPYAAFSYGAEALVRMFGNYDSFLTTHTHTHTDLLIYLSIHL